MKKRQTLRERAVKVSDEASLTFSEQLAALAGRLSKDGYPTALIERAAARNRAMEDEIVRQNSELSQARKRMGEARELLGEAFINIDCITDCAEKDIRRDKLREKIDAFLAGEQEGEP